MELSMALHYATDKSIRRTPPVLMFLCLLSAGCIIANVDFAAKAQDGATKATVPLKVQSEQCKTPIVEVKLNKKGPFLFLVDTGAESTVLSPSVISKLGIEANVVSNATVVGGANVEVRIGKLELISLGDLSVSNTYFASTEMPKGANYVGILGMNVLRRYSVTIDFQKRKIEFR